MKKLLFLFAPALLLFWGVLPGSGAPAQRVGDRKPAAPAETKPAAAKKPAVIEIKTIPEAENSCVLCHTSSDSWDPKDKDQYKYYIPRETFEALKKDVHWQKGLQCQDCHGGDPSVQEIKAHQAASEFHAVKSPADIPDFCGRCHSSIDYMRHFNPSPRTDQLAEYWTSGHGKQLKKGDTQVATCISCHDQPHGNAVDLKPHGIRPVNEPASPVYHTKVAQTCAKCHSDKDLMKGRSYNGKPLPCDEFAKWSTSVHGQALLKKGDLSAPTCNNCHGNHGAAPPQMDSVANACGACHGKIAKLFEGTKMRHKFETEHLPGCATCHGNHAIVEPQDDFLGMKEGAFCARCHEKGNEQHGATPAGREAAEAIHADLQRLKDGIRKAERTLGEAERKGMEVSEPKFDLHKAEDALTNARTQIHTFNVDVVEKAVAEGEKVLIDPADPDKGVQVKADKALAEYTQRRYWLAISLVPILIVIGLLVLYIRALPIPRQPVDSEGNGTTEK